MAEKRRSKRQKDDQKKKLTVPRAERKKRAEERRHALYVQMLDYMMDEVKNCNLPNGNLDVHVWGHKGDIYINGLIKERPQDGELIRSVGLRAAKAVINALGATEQKINATRKAFFEVLWVRVQADGVSACPEVNLSEFNEIIDKFCVFLISERPERERDMITRAAAFVKESIKHMVETQDPESLKLALSAKGE